MRDLAIVGAGPYGLSLAAHLTATQADFRIFGVPMQSWTNRMPRGMHLKSEGFASTLYDPKGHFPFSRYCHDNGIPYSDLGLPVSLDAFTRYGMAFQQRFVPMLEQKQVAKLRKVAEGFEITLDDGEISTVRRAVLAIGITHFSHIPPALKGLPETVLSHASAHHDFSGFAGKSVAVIGGGSSATDCAAALLQAGATVQIITRKAALKFHNPPKTRTLYERIRWPVTTIGSGWRSAFCTHLPLVFYAMPQRFRHEVTRRHLGPVSCWFTRDEIEGHAQVHGGSEVADASVRNGRALLTLRRLGHTETLAVDHVIAATGYKVDIDRLQFLDPALREEIRSAEKTPVLSRNFETSVPGLYFIGIASANAFGPLVRFACGAEWTVGRLSKHLAQNKQHSFAFDVSRPSKDVPLSPA